MFSKEKCFGYAVGLMSIVFGGINSQAFAAQTGRIALPILLSPDDANIVPKTTVQPMLVAPADILGARRLNFRSLANVSAEVRTGKRGKEIVISPSDQLVEYMIDSATQKFPAYCKAYQKQSLSLSGLVCLADRDSNGSFDQIWLGELANPKLWIPMPLVQLQSNAITQAYVVQKGPLDSGSKFGFSVRVRPIIMLYDIIVLRCV